MGFEKFDELLVVLFVVREVFAVDFHLGGVLDQFGYDFALGDRRLMLLDRQG